MKNFKTENLKEFRSVVGELAKSFSQKSIVLLSGPMGAGKTEFVKAFCHLNNLDHIASPTFAIHHHYENYKISVDHLDLYRIEGEDELESTGFWDLFSQNKGVIFIEWPEKMDVTQLPKDWDLFQIGLSKISEDSREIRVTKPL